MSNIYLTGMMGSGKSVTAQRLASILGSKWLDLDDLIVKRAGSSIAGIFEKEGEVNFRAREAALLKEVSQLSSHVVATGGGTILPEENVRLMRATGKIVYLETSLDVLWQRVRLKKDRPLLKDRDPFAKLGEILKFRRPIYERSCDFKTATDGLSAEAVAKNIAHILKKES